MSLQEYLNYEHGRHDVLLGMRGRVKSVVTVAWQGPSPNAAPANRNPPHSDGFMEEEQPFKQLSQDNTIEVGMSEDNTKEVDTGEEPIHANEEQEAVAQLSQDNTIEVDMSEDNTKEVDTGEEPIHANEEQEAVTQESVARVQQTSPTGQEIEKTATTNLDLFLDRTHTPEEFTRGLLTRLQAFSLEDLPGIDEEADLNPNLVKKVLVSSIHRKYRNCNESKDGSQGDSDSDQGLSVEREDTGEASNARIHGLQRTDSNDDYFRTRPATTGQNKGADTKLRLPPLCSRKKQLRCMGIRQFPRCGFACVVFIS